MDNQHLEDSIKKHRLSEGEESLYAALELNNCFTNLVDGVIKYAKMPLDKDDMRQEGLIVCWEKLDRYNPNAGKAFNFFTTCVLGHFRQLYRSSRNYLELKERYAKFLAAKKRRVWRSIDDL